MSKTDPVQRFLGALVGAVRAAFWRLFVGALIVVAGVLALLFWR